MLINVGLKKINKEDLIFSGAIEDDRTNTYLNLNDYDWMHYTLKTRFKTKDLGVLDVVFEYYGATESVMTVVQTNSNIVTTYTYRYATDIFQEYIVKFLQKHIASWNEEYAFYGEDIVIEFYNTVLEKGTLST